MTHPAHKHLDGSNRRSAQDLEKPELCDEKKAILGSSKSQQSCALFRVKTARLPQVWRGDRSSAGPASLLLQVHKLLIFRESFRVGLSERDSTRMLRDARLSRL